MKNTCANIFPLFIFLSVLLYTANGYAQRTPDRGFLNIEHVATQEKQAFKDAARVSPQGVETYRASAASANFDIHYYRCEWEIDPNVRAIQGKVTSYFTITSATDNIVFDLSDTLTVDSVTYHGQPLIFQRITGDCLQLKFASTLNAGVLDSVSIFYNGVPRHTTSMQAFVQTTHNGAPIVWTLSEPYGAKEWWPCKNGLDDKADSIDILIKNPAAYQASSNGIMLRDTVTAGLRWSFWKHRYPIASYLVAIAVSNYAVLKDTVLIGGKAMDLIDYVYPESAGDFDSQRPLTKYVLNLFGGRFGDYPFAKEKYGYTSFGNGNGGGMEHQTNSFVNAANPDLIAHETAHQWFGDRITCGSWRDVWLNEGFATYCQLMFYEQTDKQAFSRILNQLIESIASEPGGSVWVDDTTNAERIFDGRLTYHKGCYLLHMLRGIAGDDAFFRAVKRYLNDPLLQYNYATTADLQRNLELETGKNFSSFFQNWFVNQGYPTYGAEWQQDSSNNIYLTLNQTTSHPSVSFFDMPVPIEFKNNYRDTIIVFDNKRNGQTFLANPGFKADTAIFDPYKWVLCTSEIKKIACSGASSGDSLFPYYNIQWFQNSNNWIFTDVKKTSNNASIIGNSIPLYIHFSGNNRDTIFTISAIGSTYSGWINAGFKVTNAFVSTSCFMGAQYKLTGQPNEQLSNEIKIFPVPLTSNTVNISIKNPTDKSLSVFLFNSAGQLLYHQKFATPGKDELFAVPVNTAAKGVYMIKLQSESAIRTTKKIIR